MEVTEVRIKLMDEPGDRLRAFCSVTFDNCFVVRDLKIIEGATGPFVAMPSRKLTAHCRKCGTKNHLRANYCNQCGVKQTDTRAPKDADGRAKLYADIAHPINTDSREMIQQCVIQEFFEEQQRAKEPGYVSRYDDYDFEFVDSPPAKPTRVDAPHEDSLDTKPHIQTPSESPDPHPTAGPHFRGDGGGTADMPKPAVNPPSADGFGAGIFPDK